MFFSHFATVFLPHNELLSLLFRFSGRIAAPIFCFFIASGYYYTSNVKKYIFRLLIFALVSHIPYILCIGHSFFQATSVILPLAMGLIALTAFKSEKLNIILKLIIVAACCAASYRADWNFIAVLWILVFGIFHGKFKYQIAGFCIVGAFHLLLTFIRIGTVPNNWLVSIMNDFRLIPAYIKQGFLNSWSPQWFQLGIFLTIPLLAMYSGKPGKKSRFMTWFFYVFYPAHLLLLFFLNKFTPLAEMIGRLL